MTLHFFFFFLVETYDLKKKIESMKNELNKYRKDEVNIELRRAYSFPSYLLV